MPRDTKVRIAIRAEAEACIATIDRALARLEEIQARVGELPPEELEALENELREHTGTVGELLHKAAEAAERLEDDTCRRNDNE